MSVQDAFKTALDGAQRVEQLPASDRAMAQATTAMFDFCVDFIRTHGNEAIRDLGSRLWLTVNQRVVQVAIWSGVQTVHFTVVQNAGVLQALILLPGEWLKRVERECVNELGAIVFAGSQAVDYIQPWQARGKVC
jgi:hypothetical protein